MVTRKQERARMILRALRSPSTHEIVLVNGVLVLKPIASVVGYSIGCKTANALPVRARW